MLNFSTTQSMNPHDIRKDVSHGMTRNVPPAIKVMENEFDNR